MVFHNSFNISSLRWSVETKYVVNKWIYYVSVAVFASKHIVYRQFSLVASHGSQTKWIEARNKLPKIHKITVGSKRRNGNFTNHVWYVCVWIFDNNVTEFTPKKCAFYAKHNYWMSIFFFSFAARCSVNFFILIIIIFPSTCTSCFRCSLCTEKKFGYYARLCIIGRGNRELMYAITDSSELTEICSVIVLLLSIMCMKVDDNFRSLSRTMRVYIERWQTNEPNEREREAESWPMHT